jgi:hypothetical protein
MLLGALAQSIAEAGTAVRIATAHMIATRGLCIVGPSIIERLGMM